MYAYVHADNHYWLLLIVETFLLSMMRPTKYTHLMAAQMPKMMPRSCTVHASFVCVYVSVCVQRHGYVRELKNDQLNLL